MTDPRGHPSPSVPVMFLRSISRRSFGLLLGFSLRDRVIAQDLTVPTSWNITLPSSDTRAMREQYANAAAAALVGNIVADGNLSNTTESQALASMYTVLSLQDMLGGNSTWSLTVANGMKTWAGNLIDIYGNGTAGSMRTNSNGMQWALAYYYAYKAYGDSSFLTHAQSAFDTTYGDYITPSVAAAQRSAPGRNISVNLTSQCFSRASGGIFWLPDVHNNTQVQADTVGPFAVLAGLLYEETRNVTYKALGVQSVQFMGDLGWDTTNHMEVGVIDVYSCARNTGKSPQLQGWYIYALSIFANITSGDDTGTKFATQLRDAVSIAGRTEFWTQTDGVLKDTADLDYSLSDDEFESKAILVRALSETLRRFPSSEPDLVNFIEAFLTVQYNSAISTARNGSSYASTSPIGPPPITFSNQGNLVALDILNAAFAMATNDTPPASTSSPMPTTGPTTSQSSSPSSHIGAIVGGVVGGVVGLGAIAGVFFWRLRHRRLRDAQPVLDMNPVIEPFFSSERMVMNLSEGHRSKLARELPSASPSHLRVATSTLIVEDSEVRGTGAAPSAEQQHADTPLLELVGRLVNDVLRDRDAGSAPPAYGEQSDHRL